MQVEAERKKRAVILESEGVCQAEMNKAEGEKQARILRSEAQMQEQMNKSQGLAKAAEAEKIQRILQSEAEMQAQVSGKREIHEKMEMHVKQFGNKHNFKKGFKDYLI
jgi:regulator of protease activity HflC (stomatin/prohibitin superfamily)